MKGIFKFMGVAMLFFACKKTEIKSTPETVAAESSDVVMAAPKVTVLNNKLNYPWEILWGPDNFIWFTQREGSVNRMDPATGQVTLVANIPDVASTTDFNGLLGMVLHPEFSSNPYVYVVYNYFGAGGAYLEKIVRFTYNGTTLVSPMILVDGIVGKQGGNFIHNGSRLAIGPDMKLYATTGDANKRYLFPQKHNSLNGKVLRVNLDGSIPADNPFGNAVWATGQRNPQGLVFNNGTLYSSMHGEDTDDEINIIAKGGNYGWPYVQGYCDLSKEKKFCDSFNIIEPIYAWTPTIAPSGLDYYNNNAIPGWKNSLLLAVLKDEKLVQLKLNESGTAIQGERDFFKGQYGRMRDIAIAPDGAVYISTDNGSNGDMIIKVSN